MATPSDWPSQYGGFSELAEDTEGLPTGDPVTDQLAHFAACCTSGAEPRSSGRDNLGTVRLLETIERAAADAVSFPPARPEPCR